MKKRWLVLIIAAVLAAVLYVGATESQKEEEWKLLAMYLEYSDGSYIFVDTETNSPFYAVLPEELTDEKGKRLSEEELRIGDLLEVYGDGIMLESYPGQYPGVTRMKRAGKGEEEQIKAYQEMVEAFHEEVGEDTVPGLSVSYRTELAVVGAAATEGSYEFTFQNEDGAEREEKQELEPVLYLPELVACGIPEDTEITLSFLRDPKSVEVTRYPEKLREEKEKELPEGETVAVETKEEEERGAKRTVYLISSKPGYVYCVRAEFSNGTMEYGFWNTEEGAE